MKNKIVIIVLLLALAVVSYNNFARRNFEMREARGRLGLNLQIYEEAQRGDLQAVQSHLGMLILGQTRTYQQQYGVPTGTDSFAQKFAVAQAIGTQVESNLVPMSSILTNLPHTSDAKITIGGSKR